jgi:hypothetical protein
MFKIDSEQSLVTAFRPRDRAHLELPKLSYPLFVRDYLSWSDPSGTKVFLLFSVTRGAPTGIAFQRDQGSVPGARMCEWCHSYGAGDRIGLLTTDVNSRKRVGVSLCLDLSCNVKLEDAANRAGKSSVEASRALIDRIARFAREALRIDPSGAGRD